MKKQYYIHYYRNFSNTFSLVWADTPEDVEKLESRDWDRITRKYAIKKCRAEFWVRQHDQAFSGYGDTAILPAELYLAADNYDDIRCDRRYELIGRIWERRA